MIDKERSKSTNYIVNTTMDSIGMMLREENREDTSLLDTIEY